MELAVIMLSISEEFITACDCAQMKRGRSLPVNQTIGRPSFIKQSGI
jgi:hypothetical protein